MDTEKKDILRRFVSLYKNKAYALNNWLNLNNKSFNTYQALECIYDFCEGNFNKMQDVIDELTKKDKTFGRTQVYGSNINTKPDIVINNGKLQLVGFHGKTDDILKGQHGNKNPKIFRKDDSQVNKNYQKAEEKIMNLGSMVRELYPNESNQFLTMAMQAIKRYSILKKINPKKVVDALHNGRLILDDDTFTIKGRNNENINRRVIVINEEVMTYLKENTDMTEYKFYANIKDFLHNLLNDPTNVKPSLTLKKYGLTTSSLIKHLLNNKIIERDEKITDKDENGNPKVAKMKVKYKIPKKDFSHRLKKLYIKLFEKNTPLKEECEGATSAESSGEFEQPVFPIQRRGLNNIDETSTFDVGEYQNDTPFVGDEETLKRKNGVGGSVSINKIE